MVWDAGDDRGEVIFERVSIWMVKRKVVIDTCESILLMAAISCQFVSCLLSYKSRLN